MTMLDAADPGFEKRFLEANARAEAESLTLIGPSVIEKFCRLPAQAREAIVGTLGTLDRTRLLYAWELWARPKQRSPTREHRIWNLMAGRGFGKNRSGAQRVRERIYLGARKIAIIGPTFGEIEKYMLGGHDGAGGSGLLDVFHPKHRPEWKRHLGEVHFHTGAIGYVTSGELPEFRGANLDTAWCDEIQKWKHQRKLWDNLEFSLRQRLLDIDLQIIVTNTPQPQRFLKELVADSDCICYVAHTDENLSNLDPKYVKRLTKRFGGTRLEQQERFGKILGDNPDALFHKTIFDATRVEDLPDFESVCVAVDPAISVNEDSDPTGIVVLGIAAGVVYVLADLSGKYSPEVWGRTVVDAYDTWKADVVVGERNRGGDLVRSNTLAAVREKRKSLGATLRFIDVTATRGKYIRAEPVGTLHEQGRLRIVGRLPELEDEVTEWNPRNRISPNRLDAMVWGTWHLARLGEEEPLPDLEEQAAEALDGMREVFAPTPDISLDDLFGGYEREV